MESLTDRRPSGRDYVSGDPVEREAGVGIRCLFLQYLSRTPSGSRKMRESADGVHTAHPKSEKRLIWKQETVKSGM